MCVELGHSPDRFGLHSLRVGGATAAANAGVQDCLFRRHGRWRSEGAKDGYVEDSAEKRLFVSQQLGLYPFECVRLCVCGMYCARHCFVVSSVAGTESGSGLALFVTLWWYKSESIVACPCAVTRQMWRLSS